MSIDPRMTKLRSQLVIQHPFFGFLASRLQLVEAPGIGTMATNGKQWLYDPKFLDECDEPKLIFVGVHQVMHCALNHPSRRNGRDPDEWNIACDYVVNLSLREAGFIVPAEAYCDPQFKDLSVDDVYRILHSKQKQEQQSNDEENDQTTGSDGNTGRNDDTNRSLDADDSDQSSNADQSADPSNQHGSTNDGGSGDDGHDQEKGQGITNNGDGSDQNVDTTKPCSDPGRCGGVIDAAPEHDKAALDEAVQEWEVAVRQAINLARRQGEGKLPGFLEEVIMDLNTPKVDWRDIMRDWIDPSSTKDYTWAKPNRRMLPFDIIAPGTTSDGVNHVGIVVDDSLSISTVMLKQFAGEAQAALDDGKIDKMTVIFCDTRVTRTAEYVMGDIIDFTATGRGGTDFAPAFKWFIENEPGISGLIYLTDLDCSSHGPEPSFKVLWAGYEEPSRVGLLRDRMNKVPFGDCIELN